MKTGLVIMLVCLLASAASAQTDTPKPAHHHKSTNGVPPNAGNPGQPPPPDPAADLAKQVAAYQKNFVPADPWRIMNDHTNFARGADWEQFEGKVTRVTSDGIVLQGWFGEPLCYLLANGPANTTTSFLLSNYPHKVFIGELLSRNDRLVAFKSGSKNEMPNLDYGTVYVPELTEDQKLQAAQAKSKTDAKVLAWHQELADKGDAYGQYKMGLRYESGDGVDKDLEKARDFLGKSAAQGYKDAAVELTKLQAAN